MLLHRILEDSVQRRPEAVAIRCDGESLHYGDLARRAYGLSRVLLDSGLRRGDRVAVLLAKGFRVPVAFYGVLAAGGVLVPIDPKSPAEQIARIVRATDARRIVAEPSKLRVLREALKSCSDVSHVIGLESSEDLDVETVAWTELPEEDRPPSIDLIETDPCYVLHTSGSTGVPKLIRHTHHSAVSFVLWAAEEYDLTPDDRLSNHSSHHTCFATFDYYAAARAGAATVLLTPAGMMMPVSLSALLEKERVSVWYSVPTALVQLLLRGELASRDLSAVRWVLFAGETFPEKHLRRLTEQWPDARFSHVYGSTEVNVCTHYHLPRGEWTSPLPIGRPCSTSGVLIEDGELLVRGSTVMSGYWNDAERNREALVGRPEDGGFENVYFRTGDQVRLLDDGNLAFAGRADAQIKVRGHRVELGEVETALLALDAVDEAAAFAVPDDEGSSAIYAAVIARAKQREIVDGLRKLLPPYALPSEIDVLDRFPRTPTGKVDRKALRARKEDA